MGANAFGTVEASFWDVETIGMDSSDGGVGLPTELMQTLSTLKHAGWDLDEVWGIVEGETYPYLLGLSAGDSPAATLTFSGPFASVIGCVALVILLAIGWAIYRSFAGGQTDRKKGQRPVR